MPIATMPQKNTFIHFQEQEPFKLPSELQAIDVSMPIATMPERNTFIHFQDQDAESSLERSVTCPGNFVPMTRTCGSYGSPNPADDEEDAATFERTESTSTANAWPVYEMRTMALPIPARSLDGSHDASCESLFRTDSDNSEAGRSRKRMCRTLRTEAECRERLAEVFADDETPTDLGSDDDQSPIGLKRVTSWGDASTDGETPPHLRSGSYSSEDESPAEQNVLANVSVQGKKRWADLFEDEPTPLHERCNRQIRRERSTSSWEDMSTDAGTPAHLQSKSYFSEDKESPVHPKVLFLKEGKQRWADLFEDEQTPVHQESTSDLFDDQGCSANWCPEEMPLQVNN
jgi:hypothetical protein